jgi:glycosyltransferase involved in cell wall biosynthesis
MILRDEGKTIERCLKSMIGLVDEWIIGIDTKCTDNTEEMVNKFFSENTSFEKILYKYEWKDSFSKARNEGMDKATGTHILIMDGHEFFPERFYNITEGREVDNIFCFNEMKKMLETEGQDIAHIHLYQQPFIGNTPNNYFLQPRVYRNAPEIRFGRDAHNTIQNTKTNLHFPEVILIHDAPDDNREWRKKQRIEMNTKVLREDIEKNPEDLRAMFYLGNTLMENEQWEEAIKWFTVYIGKCKRDDIEIYQVYLHKASCHKFLKDFKSARDSVLMAIGVDTFRRDGYMLAGQLYFDEEKWQEAVYYFSSALRLNPVYSPMFQNGPTATWDPHQRLARSYEKIGEKEKAIAHYKAALSYFDNQGWKDAIAELSKNKHNFLIIDRIGSFTRCFVERLRKTDKFNVVYVKEFDSRLAKWADYVFCEWGDMDALECARTVPEKTVIRIHGYEAYMNKGILSQIDWSKIKKVIFVAKHIQKMLSDIIPIDRSVVIPNGVDTELFYIAKENRDINNVGYAGYINEKKNPFLLLEIIKENQDKKFHLRIDFQSPFLEETFKFELKGCKNVVYHPRYEKLADFWNQMDSVISTSIIESFSYNVAEAMACGCKPYIYKWNGAVETWGEKWIFTNRPFWKETKDRTEYRKYILNNYDNSVMIPRLLEAIIA